MKKLSNLLNKLHFPQRSVDGERLTLRHRLTFGWFVESKASIDANNRMAKIHLEQELLEDRAASKAQAEHEAHAMVEKIK